MLEIIAASQEVLTYCHRKSIQDGFSSDVNRFMWAVTVGIAMKVHKPEQIEGMFEECLLSNDSEEERLSDMKKIFHLYF